MCAFLPDTNGSDNSIPMAYLTLDHQLQVKKNSLSSLRKDLMTFAVVSCLLSSAFSCPPSALKSLPDMVLTSLILVLGKQKQEGQGFKVSFSYKTSLRSC